MAGGFTIEKKKIESLRDFILRKYTKLKVVNNNLKSLIADSIIAPSAINLEFYEKIVLLSPFGSGNPEPKFIIENVKPVNSKIVGEKHIKSILVGAEGTSIKTIAFNALNSQISSYLLKKKMNVFNIVGKLSLNDWGGVKNVEFIIDDISVNKNVNYKVPSSIG